MKTISKFLLMMIPGIVLSESFVNAQCTAGFTWSQSTNNVIDFVNTSTPSTYMYWTFGDNQNGYGQTVSHTYALPGTYQVCITIFDSLQNCNNSFCDSVVVYGSLLCNLTTNAYLAAQATCSTCNDGVASVSPYGGTPPYTYAWSNGATTQTATGLASGTYTVCVTDANSCNSCSSVVVTWANSTSCSASYTWSQTYTNEIDFNSTSTGLSNSNTVTYVWNYGDNSSGYGNSSTIAHIYQSPGTYYACLTISDSSTMCTSTFCDSVTVWGINQYTPCHASFSVHLDSLQSNLAWIWNTSTGGSGMTFQWFWGDNTSDTGLYPTHIYNNTGSYNICLVVTDTANQCSDTTCQLLMVPRMSQQTASAPFYVNVLGATGIQQHEQVSTWNLYPNPATSEIKIKTNYSLEGKMYRILDIAGREVVSGKLNSATINVSALDNGTYILQIENANGGFSANRFMKD